MFRLSTFDSMAIIFLLGVSCESNNVEELIDCSQSSLTLVVDNSTDASSCTESDGQIMVGAQGGSGEYTFSMAATSNSTGVFQNLSAGTYLVTVRDNNLCDVTAEVEVKAIGSTLSATTSVTPDSGCTNSNGVIALNATDGVMPYEFRLNDGAFSSTQVFSELGDGTQTVTIRDAEGCLLTLEVIVPKDPAAISFNDLIKPIIDTKCAIPSCHNGDLGASRNWTVNSTVLANAQNIKTRTQNRSMPPSGSLSLEQISLIGCWADGL